MPTTKPLAEGEYLFTSESVTEGHPDKVADQISDGVLDAIMAEDPRAASPARRWSTPAWRSSPARSRPTSTSTSPRSSARRSARSATTDGDFGYDCDHISVLVSLDKQSPDIAQGVDAAYETAGRPDRRRRARPSPAPATRE